MKCKYPNCNCPISFTERYKPSEIECIGIVKLLKFEPNEGYPIEMIKAGENYLKNVSFDKQLHLPALFNWHKFISEMLKSL